MTTTFPRSGLAALACTAAVLLSAPAFAATVNLKAELKSSNEVPPVDSQGSGSVTALRKICGDFMRIVVDLTQCNQPQ